jgi:phospholipid-binding lipoprotein MlaA
MRKISIFIILLLSIFFLFNGCSVKDNLTPIKSEQEIVKDPFLNEFEDEFKVKNKHDFLEPYNRFMTAFNDKFYIYIIIPMANGYKSITNQSVRDGVSNFFSNLNYPVRLINNTLQGKFKNSSQETARFLINSTIGIVGIFDIAKTGFNLDEHDEDFGQTLAVWGVGSGPHIVLPFLGPSNLRDGLSKFGDSYLDPLDYHGKRFYNVVDGEESIFIKAIQIINMEASTGLYKNIKKDAIDLYPYLKDAYNQRREKQIGE